jgi:hypothetical protein
MSNESEIELGDKVKCKITGFEAIAVGRTKWIHGCDRISVAPTVLDKDGKPQQSQGFDEAQLTIVEKGVYQSDDAKRALASRGRDTLMVKRHGPDAKVVLPSTRELIDARSWLMAGAPAASKDHDAKAAVRVLFTICEALPEYFEQYCYGTEAYRKEMTKPIKRRK